jgi:hypothetical protein
LAGSWVGTRQAGLHRSSRGRRRQASTSTSKTARATLSLSLPPALLRFTHSNTSTFLKFPPQHDAPCHSHGHGRPTLFLLAGRGSPPDTIPKLVVFVPTQRALAFSIGHHLLLLRSVVHSAYKHSFSTQSPSGHLQRQSDAKIERLRPFGSTCGYRNGRSLSNCVRGSPSGPMHFVRRGAL